MAKEITQAIENRLKRLGDRIIEDMRGNLQAKNANATGRLSKSFRQKVLRTANAIELQVLGNHYWRYVDKGRNPGRMPPVQAIRRWTRAKGIPERSAYAIAKKIGEQGTEGTDFAKDAMKEAEKRLQSEVETAIAGSLGNIVADLIVDAFTVNTQGNG